MVTEWERRALQDGLAPMVLAAGLLCLQRSSDIREAELVSHLLDREMERAQRRTRATVVLEIETAWASVRVNLN